jgi:hypothetical protein
MRRSKIYLKPAKVGVVLVMLSLLVPLRPLSAGMVTTGLLASGNRSQETRIALRGLLQREAVRQTLLLQGLDPAEALQRLEALTDEEIARMAGRLDRLVAGGDFLASLAVIGAIVFVALLILDMSGVTDFFSFVNPPRR